jgi:sugar lactone lactonase YvrE
MTPRQLSADLVVDAHATLGEGARWDLADRRLYWVDIVAPALHVYDPATDTDRVVPVDRYLGAVAPRASGGLIAAVQEGFATLDPTTGAVDLLTAVHASDSGLRMNDGNCDPQGRFWAGSMALDERPGAGSLYRLDPDGSVVTMLTDVTISNGIVWSPDEATVYYIDTPTRRVDAFSFDPDEGTIRDRRPIVSVPAGPGSPDGMTIDADGCLWVALYGGSAVHRYTPNGVLDAVLPIPATATTCCAFGGADLDVLYITTAAKGTPPGAVEPHAGGLFAVDPGVRGLPTTPYAG